jgi:hypothetical protein
MDGPLTGTVESNPLRNTDEEDRGSAGLRDEPRIETPSGSPRTGRAWVRSSAGLRDEQRIEACAVWYPTTAGATCSGGLRDEQRIETPSGRSAHVRGIDLGCRRVVPRDGELNTGDLPDCADGVHASRRRNGSGYPAGRPRESWERADRLLPEAGERIFLLDQGLPTRSAREVVGDVCPGPDAELVGDHLYWRRARI